MIPGMTQLVFAIGSLLFFIACVLAVRANIRRQVLPTYVTTTCAQCGNTIDPEEGDRIRGEMYCSGGCARWAW